MPAEDGEALVELRVQVLPLPAPQLRRRLLEPTSGVMDIVGLNICLGTNDAGQVGLPPGFVGCLFCLLLLFLRLFARGISQLQTALCIDRLLLGDLTLPGFVIPGVSCSHESNARARDSTQQDHE